ncbi:hypothetical protein ACHAWF_003771, partial [Thalassiosira exigua]
MSSSSSAAAASPSSARRRRPPARRCRACAAAAALLVGIGGGSGPRVEAFSLAREERAAGAKRGASSSASASTSAAAAVDPRGSGGGGSAPPAASNAFRGSLHGRRRGRRPSAAGPSDDFSLRMSAEVRIDADAEGGSSGAEPPQEPDSEPSSGSSSPDGEEQLHERRAFLSSMLATTAAGFTAAVASSSDESTAANAYEQAYPLELQSASLDEAETSSNSLTKLKEERIANKKAKVASTKSELRTDPLGLNQSPYSENFGPTVAGASAWALALWFAAGSRSNPLATPLANVLYDREEEPWLADRNEGYFAELPPTFAAILSAVFVFFGVVLDRAVYFLADGDAEVSLQLAGVSVIGGAVWEVGRLAAKEKPPTREEYERDVLLHEEFDEFAQKRIVVGRGSCHRSDVISAFRRYNPKYRTADNERFPLVDVEIERMLKRWNRQFGSGSEMSSAGFFAGIV